MIISNIVIWLTFNIFSSFGIPEKEWDGGLEAKDRQYRLEAIHMRGLKHGNISLSFWSETTIFHYSFKKREWVKP
jgi:hypothetical protein